METVATKTLTALEAALARKGYRGSFLVTDLGWGVKAEWNGQGTRRDINDLCCREAVQALEAAGYEEGFVVRGCGYLTVRKPAKYGTAA